MGCLKLTYQENEPLLKCVWNKNEPEKSGQWFLFVDPLAEKYPNISSYVYCVNNPVKFFDPDGRDVEISRNDENRSITVRANYYYSKSNLEVKPEHGSVVENVSNTLESVKSDISRSIAESNGVNDYSVIFEFNLIDVDGTGGNAIDMANADQIGNSITHDESVSAEGLAGTVRNYKHIRFNSNTALADNFIFFESESSDMKHEIFHTLGLLDRYNKGSETSPRYDAPYIENDLMTKFSPQRGNGVEPFKRVMNAAGILLPRTQSVIINKTNKEKP